MHGMALGERSEGFRDASGAKATAILTGWADDRLHGMEDAARESGGKKGRWDAAGRGSGDGKVKPGGEGEARGDRMALCRPLDRENRTGRERDRSGNGKIRRGRKQMSGHEYRCLCGKRSRARKRAGATAQMTGKRQNNGMSAAGRGVHRGVEAEAAGRKKSAGTGRTGVRTERRQGGGESGQFWVRGRR